MRQFFDKAIRAIAKIATAVAGLWERRSPAVIETLSRKKMEAERIDRLRNPSNYQGR
jgi:hypothetical protein